MADKSRPFGKREIIFIVLLFLLTFYLRTLPFQENPMPFGEGDAAHQYGNAEWMAWLDSAQRQPPTYFAFWYGELNEKNHFAPNYPPVFYVDMAVLHQTTGEMFLAKNIWFALTSVFLLSLGMFFLLRRYYGFYAGALASLLILTSFRNIMSYLWGQRLILLAHAFIPLIIYAYFRYVEEYQEGRDRPGYFILVGSLLAFSGLAHPMGQLVGIAILAVFTLYLILKHRKLPFSLKSFAIGVGVFAILFVPFVPDLFEQSSSHALSSGIGIQHPESLLQWYYPEDAIQNMYGYANLNWGYWSLPFLIAGILFLLIRRRMVDWMLLTWLIALYLVLHLDVFNLAPYALSRALTGTSTIFYSIMAVGVTQVPRLIKVSKPIRSYIRLGLIVLFLALAFMNAFLPSVGLLQEAYPGVMRITPSQVEAVGWIDENLPEDASIFIAGTLTYAKTRYMHMLSHRAIQPTTGAGIQNQIDIDEGSKYLPDYVSHVLVDTSDFLAIGQQETVLGIEGWEKTFLADSEKGGEKTLVYDRSGIRIYELEEPYGTPSRVWDWRYRQ